MLLCSFLQSFSTPRSTIYSFLHSLFISKFTIFSSFSCVIYLPPLIFLLRDPSYFVLRAISVIHRHEEREREVQGVVPVPGLPRKAMWGGRRAGTSSRKARRRSLSTLPLAHFRSCDFNPSRPTMDLSAVSKAFIIVCDFRVCCLSTYDCSNSRSLSVLGLFGKWLIGVFDSSSFALTSTCACRSASTAPIVPARMEYHTAKCKGLIPFCTNHGGSSAPFLENECPSLLSPLDPSIETINWAQVEGLDCGGIWLNGG